MTNTNQITSFINPYRECRAAQADEPARINIDIDRDDLNFIKGIRLSGGTLSTTVGILYKKLVNELKRRNITDITKRKEFEQFLVEFEFIIPRELSGSTTGIADKQANGPDDKRGNEGTGAGDKETENKQSVISSSPNGKEGEGKSSSKRGVKQRSV